VALGVNGLQILIEKNDGGGILYIGGGGSFGGIKAPLRKLLLVLAEPTGEGGRWSQKQRATRLPTKGLEEPEGEWKILMSQFPFAVGLRARTSCC
jgi:hypothetical protein